MDGNLPQILCCNCGITIEQNACNMCITCIRNTIDITSEINKKLTIHSCRTCQRYRIYNPIIMLINRFFSLSLF